MKRRIVSLLMCFVMMFGMLPTAAWAELIPAQGETEEAASNTAYEVGEDTAVQSGENGIAVMAAGENEAEYNGKEYATLAEAFAAAESDSGGTVTVLKDMTLDCTTDDKGIVWASGYVTLDLNGKTVTKSVNVVDNSYHALGDYAVFCLKGGSLTIMDSATGGKIVQPNDNPVVAVTGGTLTVNGGTLEATKTDGYKNDVMQWFVSCAVMVVFSGTGSVNLNGGTFWGGTAGVVAMNGPVYITGGDFYGATSYALYVNGQNAAVLSGGTYTTGATDQRSIWYTSYGTADVLLASGYQYADESSAPLAITGEAGDSGVVGNARVVPAAGTVEYIGEGGTKQVCTDATELTTNSTSYLNKKWYVVTGGRDHR